MLAGQEMMRDRLDVSHDHIPICQVLGGKSFQQRVNRDKHLNISLIFDFNNNDI